MATILSCVAGLLVLLTAEPAWAWGPATHLEFGLRVLDHVHHLAPYVAGLLSAYPEDYLYGNVGADVTIAKNLARYVNHAHNWQVAFRLLNEARTERQKAFAYGFLTHLSVDIISHNYYVPRKQVASYRHPGRGHAYWELRVEEKLWKEGRSSDGKDGKVRFDRRVHAENDELMSSVIRKTLFNHKLNRRIFDGVMQFMQLRNWRKAFGVIARRSRLELEEEEVEEVLELGLEAALSLLQHHERSPTARIDPTGARSLRIARDVRKRLRALYKSKRVDKETCDEWAGALRDSFRNGIYSKLVIPPLPEPSEPAARAS
jgi:hypothetical protein